MGDAFGFPTGGAERGVGRVAPSCGPGEGCALGGLGGQPANCRDVWETGLGLGEELGLVVGRGARRGCLRPDVSMALSLESWGNEMARLRLPSASCHGDGATARVPLGGEHWRCETSGCDLYRVDLCLLGVLTVKKDLQAESAHQGSPPGQESYKKEASRREPGRGVRLSPRYGALPVVGVSVAQSACKQQVRDGGKMLEY